MAARKRGREAQVERNRGLLLAAARRVFLARGYHGSTLEAIAADAGFSKGVVYSQFESKADLFLTLLDERIAERAAENERAVREAGGGAAAAAALYALGRRRAQRETDWNLLLLEFRAQAAREPALNERYAKAHARTIDGIAGLLTRMFEAAGVEPARPPELLATFVLALTSGVNLENLVAPGSLRSLPADAVVELLERTLGLGAEAT
jgi:AcrR family transcriptional regulator